MISTNDIAIEAQARVLGSKGKLEIGNQKI
jgi:hypothetical protein